MWLSGTVCTAPFSKKSLWSDVGEIKKMSVKLKLTFLLNLLSYLHMTSEVQDISEAYIHLIHKTQFYTTDYNIYIYKIKKKSLCWHREMSEKNRTQCFCWFTIKRRQTPTLTIRHREIKKWDINLYLYICMFLRFVYKTVIFDNMNNLLSSHVSCLPLIKVDTHFPLYTHFSREWEPR
jgi:hypothetical protein